MKECELLRVYSSWQASLLLLEAHSFPRAHTSYPVTLHVLAFYCWFVASRSEDGCYGSRNHDLLDPLRFLPSIKGNQIYFLQTSTLIKTWSHSPPAFKTGTATWGSDKRDRLTCEWFRTNHGSSLKVECTAAFLYILPFKSSVLEKRQEMTRSRSLKLIRVMPNLSETHLTLWVWGVSVPHLLNKHDHRNWSKGISLFKKKWWIGLESCFSGQRHRPLFQKICLQFPALMWWLATICNSNSRGIQCPHPASMGIRHVHGAQTYR